MRKPRNYFNVGVRFKSHAYSITSRNDVEMTPDVVLAELEDFCLRVRRDILLDADKPARCGATVTCDKEPHHCGAHEAADGRWWAGSPLESATSDPAVVTQG